MDYGRRRGAYFISIDKLRLTNYNGVSIVATLCLAYHLLFYRSLSGAKAKTMWSTERERITNLQICWTAVTTETATWPVVKLTEVMPRRYCTRMLYESPAIVSVWLSFNRPIHVNIYARPHCLRCDFAFSTSHTTRRLIDLSRSFYVYSRPIVLHINTTNNSVCYLENCSV